MSTAILEEPQPEQNVSKHPPGKGKQHLVPDTVLDASVLCLIKWTYNPMAPFL